MDNLYSLAACRGRPLSEFFEEYEQDRAVAEETDDLCFSCPVREECLKKLGVDSSGTGVFGGAYLVLGKYSKTRNAHKDPYIGRKLQEEVETLRKNR